MRIFAVHFLSSRQRLMDAEAEFLGFKAVRQQECQVRLAPPSENLTASGKLFFFRLRLIFRSRRYRPLYMSS